MQIFTLWIIVFGELNEIKTELPLSFSVLLPLLSSLQALIPIFPPKKTAFVNSPRGSEPGTLGRKEWHKLCLREQSRKIVPSQGPSCLQERPRGAARQRECGRTWNLTGCKEEKGTPHFSDVHRLEYTQVSRTDTLTFAETGVESLFSWIKD